jgi:plastocyanin
VIPDKLSGTANVTASAVGITAQRALNISCQSPASVPAQTAAAAPAAVAPAAIAPPATGPAPMTVQEQVRNFAYSPVTISGQVGQPITVNVTNSGPSPHTFTIDGLTDSGSIANGTSKSVTFTPTQARTYTFYCTIHGAAVLSGTLTVTAGGAVTTTTASTATAVPAPMPAPAPQAMGGGSYGY